MPSCIKNKVHKVIVDSYLSYFYYISQSHISLSIWTQVLVVAVVKSKASYSVMIARQTLRSLSGEENYKNGENLNFSTIFNFFHACMSANARTSDGFEQSIFKSSSQKVLATSILQCLKFKASCFILVQIIFCLIHTDF